MNPAEFINDLLFVVSSQVGVTLPRIVAGLVGLLLVIAILVGRWERRVKVMPTLLITLAGLLLLAMAVDTRVLHAIMDSSFSTRVRVLLGLVSALVLAVTFESIRISRLRERYALLWVGTAAMVLVAALYPQTIRFLTVVLGVQYVTAVVAVVFTFLLLVAFHFSIALSALEDDRSQLAQRHALLENRVFLLEQRMGLAAPAPGGKAISTLPGAGDAVVMDAPCQARFIPGTVAASALVMVLAVGAVLGVGLTTRQAMIGDEVTHYYMLTRQAGNLTAPNYFADIPNGWSAAPEVRRYPHPNGWHYLGALTYRLCGQGFWSVQLYQALFLLQLLVVMYLWARHRRGVESQSALLMTIVLASIPMNLLFSVAFYQDVPMAAQAVTAFYLIDRKRWIPAALFLGLAMWMKVTGILFVLPFLAVAAYRTREEARDESGARSRRALVLAATGRWIGMLVIIGAVIWGNGYGLRRYAEARFYPSWRLEQLIKDVLAPSLFHRNVPAPARTAAGANPVRPVTPFEAKIIANHPGDLRHPANFVIYGGALLWLVLASGVAGLLRPRSASVPAAATRRRSWPLAVGLFYILITAWQLRTAPDARFFLPGLPFVLLPMCEWSMRLPKARWLLVVAAVLAIFQGAQALGKAGGLRGVSPALREAIQFLGDHPPAPRRIFMYPEGNYRLFPVAHEWYLGYRLREFWRGNNDFRLEMLRQQDIGAVVVKKHLVALMDPDMSNLGIYPVDFVTDLRGDKRFPVVFENSAVIVFQVESDAPR
jgi:hypothetical protein